MFERVTRGQVVAGLAIAVIGGATAAALYAWLESRGDPEQLREQVAAIREDAAEGDTHLVENRRVDLEGGGEQAYFFVFRHGSQRPLLDEGGPQPISDEVRIYRRDEDGKLVLALSFQPTPAEEVDLNGDTVRTPYFFDLRSLRDLDGNGRPELIGAFVTRAMSLGYEDPLPVALTWDDADQKYALLPLLTTKPNLRRPGNPGTYARLQWPTPVRLTDPQSRRQVYGYTAGGYAVVRSQLEVPGLLVGYIPRGSPKRIEAQLVLFDLQGPEVRTHTCTPDPAAGRGQPAVEIHDRGVVIPKRFGGGHAERDTSAALTRAWPLIKSLFRC